MNLAGIFLTRFVLGLRRWTPLPLFLPQTSTWTTAGLDSSTPWPPIWTTVEALNTGNSSSCCWLLGRKAAGSGPAPLGRRFKDRRGEVVTLTGGQVVRARNPPVCQNRRPHNLILAISGNAEACKILPHNPDILRLVVHLWSFCTFLGFAKHEDDKQVSLGWTMRSGRTTLFSV